MRDLKKLNFNNKMFDLNIFIDLKSNYNTEQLVSNIVYKSIQYITFR